MTVSSSTTVYLALEPVDLRKSIDGLAVSVGRSLERDPTSGEVFVFRNRAGTAIKVLYWASNGFVLVYKRLERGCFRFPDGKQGEWHLSPDLLSCLLDGTTVNMTNA